MIAIDPGLRATSWAVFESGRFRTAGYARPWHRETSSEAVRAVVAEVTYEVAGAGFRVRDQHLVIEFPQVYMSGPNDRNDLLPLAAIGGALACAALSAQFVKPREWKGQTPKPKKGEPHESYVIRTRALARSVDVLEHADMLASVQRAAPLSLQHNVWDAIGIGLWALGRFEPKKVIAR